MSPSQQSSQLASWPIKDVAPTKGHLLTLPNELLLPVLKDLHPLSQAMAGVTCRRLYSLTPPKVWADVRSWRYNYMCNPLGACARPCVEMWRMLERDLGATHELCKKCRLFHPRDKRLDNKVSANGRSGGSVWHPSSTREVSFPRAFSMGMNFPAAQAVIRRYYSQPPAQGQASAMCAMDVSSRWEAMSLVFPGKKFLHKMDVQTVITDPQPEVRDARLLMHRTHRICFDAALLHDGTPSRWHGLRLPNGGVWVCGHRCIWELTARNLDDTTGGCPTAYWKQRQREDEDGAPPANIVLHLPRLDAAGQHGPVHLDQAGQCMYCGTLERVTVRCVEHRGAAVIELTVDAVHDYGSCTSIVQSPGFLDCWVAWGSGPLDPSSQWPHLYPVRPMAGHYADWSVSHFRLGESAVSHPSFATAYGILNPVEDKLGFWTQLGEVMVRLGLAVVQMLCVPFMLLGILAGLVGGLAGYVALLSLMGAYLVGHGVCVVFSPLDQPETG